MIMRELILLRIEWLGYYVDSTLMTVSIPRSELEDTLEDCTKWLSRTKAHKKALQSLAGHLAFISNCVQQGRKFMSRLLATIRDMKDRCWTIITDPCRQDILWFVTYVPEANGVSLYRPTRNVINIDINQGKTFPLPMPSVGSTTIRP